MITRHQALRDASQRALGKAAPTGNEPPTWNNGVGVGVATMEREVEEVFDALEGMTRQFAYWSDSAGGLWTGGLSALEEAFHVLGWDDPHPLPDRRCDEPGCMKDATMGWPTRPGGTGLNGGYRRTCWDHSDIGRERANQADQAR